MGGFPTTIKCFLESWESNEKWQIRDFENADLKRKHLNKTWQIELLLLKSLYFPEKQQWLNDTF